MASDPAISSIDAPGKCDGYDPSDIDYETTC